MGWCLSCLVVTFGFLALATSLLFIFLNPVIETAVRSQLVLKEGNDLWTKWVDIPVGLINYRYRFFEVENPDEALKGAKVRVRERGPYCFTHRRYKRIIGWGPNNETVRYFEYKLYYFDHACSAPNTLDDTFYMINPLFAALGQTISDMIETQLPMAPLTSPIVYTVVNGIMDAHGQSLFMKKSVRDVLFGFKINLLETLDTFVNPLRRLGISLDALPPNPPDNMFGLLYGRNNTPEGEHEIYTGLHGTSHMFGYFASHKGQKALKFWKGEKCNQIVGSDGSLFPPFATSKTVLYAFAMDLCRSFYFNAIGTGEYKGIKGLLYTLPNEAFAAPNRLPDNECFCMFTGKRKEKRCSTEGVFDLGGCQGGAPLLVSKPHFIDTHPDLSKNVDGLNPDPEKHATFLILEPTTAGGLFGSKKLQFALRVERIPYLRNFQGIRSAVIPFLWAEEYGGVNDEIATELKTMLVTPLKYAPFVVGAMALGTTAMFLFLLSLKGCFNSKRKVTPRPSLDQLMKPMTPPQPTTAISIIGNQANGGGVMANSGVTSNGFIPPPPPLPPPAPPQLSHAIQTVVEKARAAFRTGKTRSVEFRKRQLDKLMKLLEDNEELLCEAVGRDMRKHPTETFLFEIDVCKNDILIVQNHLDEWAKPQPIPKVISSMFDKIYIRYEPYGVALIIAPWNYPVQLTFAPLLGAIAAGCTVVLKPSELSPWSSRVMAYLITHYLDPDCYQVIEGGPEVSKELLAQKWDVIFYTGSTRVGKMIHEAATKHLTPVILELGGKSPCYVDESTSDLEMAVKRMVWGKTVNCGQTCVAPDYFLCTKRMQENIIKLVPKVLKEFFGNDYSRASDMARIINHNHVNRLTKLLECTRGRIVLGGKMRFDEKYIEPTVVADVPFNDILMEDELFGPIMPIVVIKSIDEAIAIVNSKEKPLALYVFTGKSSDVERFTNETSSGSICVNDVMVHVIMEGVPFGGVGFSGIGAYHGKFSFEAFSHAKPVMERNFNPLVEMVGKQRYFPYTPAKVKIMQMLLKTRNTGVITRILTPTILVLLGFIGHIIWLRMLPE